MTHLSAHRTKTPVRLSGFLSVRCWWLSERYIVIGHIYPVWVGYVFETLCRRFAFHFEWIIFRLEKIFLPCESQHGASFHVQGDESFRVTADTWIGMLQKPVESLSFFLPMMPSHVTRRSRSLRSCRNRNSEAPSLEQSLQRWRAWPAPENFSSGRAFSRSTSNNAHVSCASLPWSYSRSA